MNKSIELIKKGFESSSETTPEFLEFYRTFKSEFRKELKSIGATNIVFSRGHFYVSGFFTLNGQGWYFSIPDVRHMNLYTRDSHFSDLLYRKVKHCEDYTGEYNRYVNIEIGMAKNMDFD